MAVLLCVTSVTVLLFINVVISYIIYCVIEPILHTKSLPTSFLLPVALTTIVYASITSRLDLCNSLLYGLLDNTCSKLQHIRNCPARITSNTKQSEHITPVFQKLHCLPVKERIKIYILLLVYKSLNGYAPNYLSH